MRRGITKSNKRLTFLSIASKVTVTMEISMAKFMRLIVDGVMMVNKSKIKYGHTWHHEQGNSETFLRELREFQRVFNDVVAGNKQVGNLNRPQMIYNLLLILLFLKMSQWLNLMTVKSMLLNLKLVGRSMQFYRGVMLFWGLDKLV